MLCSCYTVVKVFGVSFTHCFYVVVGCCYKVGNVFWDLKKNFFLHVTWLPGCCYAVAISVLMSSKCLLHVIVVMWLPGCYYTFAVRLLRCSKCILHVSGRVLLWGWERVLRVFFACCCYVVARVLLCIC